MRSLGPRPAKADEPPEETKRPKNFSGLFSAYSPTDFILARQTLFLLINPPFTNSSPFLATPKYGGC